MRIAPEGVPFVVAGGALLLVLTALALWTRSAWWVGAAAAWFPCAIWVPWFFRDPERAGPRGDGLIIAPADGRIVDIAEVDEPEVLAGPARRISVFMSVFDVHVNRHPVTGTVQHRRYEPGAFVNAGTDKASLHNERMSLGIVSGRGTVLVRQIAGLIARRIVTDPALGDAVTQGERLGLIRFGSRVDTFLPTSARVAVEVGDRSTAGVTVIAEWT